MFNEWDRKCTGVQLMHSPDPSYDNRTIASTLKMQIRTVQRLRAQLNASDDPLEVVELKATSCHCISSKSAWKSTPKCTWMCWRVRWSPGVIRWPVADPGCGSRTRRQATSPKRPRLGFRRSATTLYTSLTKFQRIAGVWEAIQRSLHLFKQLWGHCHQTTSDFIFIAWV